MNEPMASVNMAGILENAIREFGLSSDMAEADMETSSIPSAWLLSGQAQTRSRLLGKTHDRLASVMLWECGAANFNRHYRKDGAVDHLVRRCFRGGQDRRGASFAPLGRRIHARRERRHLAYTLSCEENRHRQDFHKPTDSIFLKAWIKLLELAGAATDSGH